MTTITVAVSYEFDQSALDAIVGRMMRQERILAEQRRLIEQNFAKMGVTFSTCDEFSDRYGKSRRLVDLHARGKWKSDD